jgi:hypothetical protein
LIALNPDGSEQLCHPASRKVAPPASVVLSYPPDPKDGYGLTDGVGLQAFVLIASRRPLPPYAEWRRGLGDLPWKPARSAAVWRYDGETFETDSQRGTVRPRADFPTPLEAACRLLKARPGVEAIRALAFPVQPASGTGGG